jgi:hypothetical protein
MKWRQPETGVPLFVFLLFSWIGRLLEQRLLGLIEHVRHATAISSVDSAEYIWVTMYGRLVAGLSKLLAIWARMAGKRRSEINIKAGLGCIRHVHHVQGWKWRFAAEGNNALVW